MGQVVPMLTKLAVLRAGENYKKSWRRREQNMVEARLEKLADDLLASKLKVLGLQQMADVLPRHFLELHTWLTRNERTE